MKSFESEIKKYAEKTRLKAVEREMVRDRILSYMEYHPLKKEHVSLRTLGQLGEGDFFYVHFNTVWMRVGSGALALFFMVGVPLLAERSVPGDVLYLVKTEVNEGIRTQLATTPYEKVALETKLMERRISEARLLAQEGKLTTEVEAKIAQTVKGHANAVQSGLAEIREDDADGAALAEIVFNSALEVQSAVLGTNENIDDTSSVGTILDVVNTVRNEVASDENPSTPSYDGLIARVETETTRAYELFASIKESATPEEIADIERRLSDIDRSIVAAKTLQETDETGSVSALVDVLGLIQKLITFMTDIDVRETVALETLVPVIPTQEERLTRITKTMEEISAERVVLEKKLPLIPEEGLLEKITAGLKMVEENTTVIGEALKAANIETAEALVRDTEAIVGDMSMLTESIVLEEMPESLGGEGGVSPETGTTTDSGATSTVAEPVGTEGGVPTEEAETSVE